MLQRGWCSRRRGRCYCFRAGVEHAIRHQATRPVRRVRRDPGQEAGLMEPFTLLMMRPGLEETQIENMSRGDCIDRLLTIQGDRDLTKGQMHRAGGSILPTEPADSDLQCCRPFLPLDVARTQARDLRLCRLLARGQADLLALTWPAQGRLGSSRCFHGCGGGATYEPVDGVATGWPRGGRSTSRRVPHELAV